KTWTNIEGRVFLIESVRYSALKPLLDKLQAAASSTNKIQTAKLTFRDRGKLVAQAFPRREKSSVLASIRKGHPSRESGLVLDYQTINTSQSNYTFAADATTYLTAEVSLSGTTRFEGGSVVKLAPTNSAGLTVLGSSIWSGSDCRPTIISARDDDSCGESVAASSGNPATNFYGLLALQVYDDSPIKNVRISFAVCAVMFSAYSQNFSLSHAQIGNCQWVFDNLSGTDGSAVTLHNV